MAVKRDLRRVGAASATVSAGALVFFAAGTGPASAATTTECKLGKLLCGILGAGTGTPATPPKSSAPPKTSAKPAAPHPKPAPARPRQEGSGDVPADPAPPPAEQNDPAVPVPDSSQQAPALPDVAPQDPVVFPETAPRPARPVAATAPDDPVPPPLLVATASGLIGAVAALNLSIVNHRRRARRENL